MASHNTRRGMICGCLLGLTLLLPAATAADQEPDDRAAYIERGRQTEARQQAHHARIDRFYEALSDAVRRAAPDLLPEIAPPPPAVQGYQILPTIVADRAAPAPGTKARVVRFSWQAVDFAIERQLVVLDRLERRLRSLPRVRASSRRDFYLSLAKDYQKLVRQRRTLDSNITYNWLWQQRIADDRPLFDYLKRIQDLAIERDAIAAALAEGSDETPKDTGATLGVDAALGSELRAAISDRFRALQEGITAAARTPAPPDFVRIERPAPGRWLVRVPLYTDLNDSAFVREFREGIEGWWSIHDGDEEYRVELEVRTLSPEHLYCRENDGTDDSGADCAPPVYGEEIDLSTHVARFPQDGAVLTTGATTLKTSGPRAIVLGPHDTAPRVLAHEFGHILGFPDTYFRGYEELGADGFEITELADLTDIMGAPGAGPVMPRHFTQLLAGKARSELNRSLALFNQGHFTEAVAAARQALTSNPNFAEAYSNMSAAYTALGQWDDAIQAATRALDLNPDFQLARNNLNWARQEQARATASAASP